MAAKAGLLAVGRGKLFLYWSRTSIGLRGRSRVSKIKKFILWLTCGSFRYAAEWSRV